MSIDEAVRVLAREIMAASIMPQKAAAEREAQAAKRGLYSVAEPMAPWEWRRGESKRK